MISLLKMESLWSRVMLSIQSGWRVKSQLAVLSNTQTPRKSSPSTVVSKRLENLQVMRSMEFKNLSIILMFFTSTVNRKAMNEKTRFQNLEKQVDQSSQTPNA